jgi:hypothetical protein
MRIVSLTARLRLRATSTFADDFAVAGGISGNGVPTPPGTTPTTARAFADPGTGHDDDAVCDDDEDPD